MRGINCDMNNVVRKIKRMKERNILQFRKADILVLSSVTYSALRRDVVGTDELLEMIISGMTLPQIKEYDGMKLVVLDSDDPDIILIG
jgi:hypothetical protein